MAVGHVLKEIYRERGPFVEALHAKEALIEETRRKKRAKLFLPLYARYHPELLETDIDSSRHPGDLKIDRLLAMLDRVYRSAQQKQFHMSFISSCLRFIYEDDFDKEKHRVMKKYGFKSRKELVLVCCPRRFGKTFATALFCVVGAICLPTIEFSIFSPGKRQSIKLMEAITQFLDKIGEKKRMVKRNEEVMHLHSVDGRISKINAYPSNVQTLRGVSANVMIMEEFAQIDPKVLYQVVTPLLQLDKTCMIGISTVTDEDNFMSKFMNQKNKHGEPLFEVARFYLACKSCRDQGTKVAAKCNHNKHLLPAWSTSRKRKLVNAIMEGEDDMLAQEICGVTSEKHQHAFAKHLIDQFVELERVILSHQDSYPNIFITIDPCGGGKESDFSFITTYRQLGVHTILGMESFPSTSALDNDTLIIDHVRQLRSDIRFAKSRIVFILENNLGMESERISVMLNQSLHNFLVMTHRDDDQHIGFRTTDSVKMLAVDSLREKLGENMIRVVVPNDLVSLTIDQEDPLEFLIDQMRKFSEIIKANAPGSRVKVQKRFSGKSSGKDDLMMTLLLSVYWSSFFYSSPKYANYR